MVLNPKVVRAYLDHFPPRDVVGPVVIVFSLEGVIDGVFGLSVPDEFAMLGWGVVFVPAVLGVTYWGTVDEEAVEELQDRLEAIETPTAADT